MGFEKMDAEASAASLDDVLATIERRAAKRNADKLAKVGKEIIKQAKAKTSNKARVAAIIEEHGDAFFAITTKRKEIIEKIVNTLGVTKANAGVYVYNYKKAKSL